MIGQGGRQWDGKDWQQTPLPKDWAMEQETPGMFRACLPWPLLMASIMAGIVIAFLW